MGPPGSPARVYRYIERPVCIRIGASAALSPWAAETWRFAAMAAASEENAVCSSVCQVALAGSLMSESSLLGSAPDEDVRRSV